MEAKKGSGSVLGWIKTHKKYVISGVAAGLVGAVLLTGGIYHLTTSITNLNSTRNELSGANDINDQLTAENQQLQNDLDAAKNAWEFAPSDEQVVTLKGFMQGKQGKGMAFDSATFENGRMTLWFSTKSQGKDALVSMDISAPATPFKTEDVMKAIEEQANLADASLQPQVHLYTANVEDYVRQGKDAVVGLANAIAGVNQKDLANQIAGAAADQIAEEGNATVVQDATVWYSFESGAPDVNGNRTISMYVAKRDANGTLHCEKAGQRDDVQNTDQGVISLVGDYARQQGINVDQIKDQAAEQGSAEAE